MAVQLPEMLFDEVLDFLASTPTPEQILDFKPSDTLQQRTSDLLRRQKDAGLSLEERAELDDLARLDHFMSMLKIRARKKLST